MNIGTRLDIRGQHHIHGAEQQCLLRLKALARDKIQLTTRLRQPMTQSGGQPVHAAVTLDGEPQWLDLRFALAQQAPLNRIDPRQTLGSQIQQPLPLPSELQGTALAQKQGTGQTRLQLRQLMGQG